MEGVLLITKIYILGQIIGIFLLKVILFKHLKSHKRQISLNTSYFIPNIWIQDHWLWGKCICHSNQLYVSYNQNALLLSQTTYIY